MHSKKQYYFDYTASTPIDKEVLKTYTDVLEAYYANPSSSYALGLEVRNLVESSREKIAKLLGVLSEEVIFTSGASEANSFAISGYALKYKHRGKHIISSKMEHPATQRALQQLIDEQGFHVSYVNVHKDGKVHLEDIKEALREDTILTCLMAVNNEIGSIQDIEEIGTFLKENSRSAFFVDGVQQVGKFSLDLKNVDLYSWTTHKIYGIKGSGALIKKKRIELRPLIHGSQEQGLRGGTLNAPAYIVMAKTLRLALDHQEEHVKYVKELSSMLYEELYKLDGVELNSNPKTCVANIVNFSWTSMNSEIMMNGLNERNIYVSSQSACSSKTKKPSHTLLAMGYDEKRALATIRISLSHLTTKEEVTYLISSIKEIVHDYTT